jgi:hypothetical protein
MCRVTLQAHGISEIRTPQAGAKGVLISVKRALRERCPL